MVRINGRESAEGGSDVDDIDELKRTRQDVNVARLAAQSEARQ